MGLQRGKRDQRSGLCLGTETMEDAQKCHKRGCRVRGSAVWTSNASKEKQQGWKSKSQAATVPSSWAPSSAGWRVRVTGQGKPSQMHCRAPCLRAPTGSNRKKKHFTIRKRNCQGEQKKKIPKNKEAGKATVSLDNNGGENSDRRWLEMSLGCKWLYSI